MKRKLVLIMMAMMLAIMGVQPLFAQDLGLSAANQNRGALQAAGVGNRGVTGANVRNRGGGVFTTFLNTLINQGAGLSPNGLSEATIGFRVADVAVGDVNADGRNDIVAIDHNVSANASRIVVFVGQGDGTFGLPLVLLTTVAGGSSVRPVSIAATDADLDGLTDFAIAYIANTAGGTVVTGALPGVQILSGAQIFGLGLTNIDVFRPITALGGATIPAAVAFGRIDGDALADVVITIGNTTGSAGAFQVLLSSTGFVLSAPIATTGGIFANTLDDVGNNVRSLRSVSIQQSNACTGVAPALTPPDADLDVFISTNTAGASGAGRVEIYENQGSGTFVALTALGTANAFDATGGFLAAGTTPVGVATVDVNGDNKVDVLALNRGSGTVSTFLAGAPNLVDPIGCNYGSPTQALAGANPVSLTLMNFNGDNRVDIAVANSSAGTNGFGDISILVGTGSGSFQRTQVFFDPVNPQSVAVGQFDTTSPTDDLVIADARFVLGTINSPGGVIYLSAGFGYSPVVLQTFTTSSLASDFDGAGGINDFVIVEQALGFVFVLLNVGAANVDVGILAVADLFTAANIRPTSATAFRDANGRNSLAITDVLTPTNTTGAGQIIIGINDGSGTVFRDVFQFRQFVATPGATNVLSGDFNNDGNSDLVYVDFGSNFAAVALNDGTDFFLTPQFRETGGFIPVSAAIGDVNDDDNLDVVAVNQGTGGIQFNQSLVSVLVGQGDGRLVPTGALLQVPNFALSIVGGLSADPISGSSTVRRVVDFNADGYPDFAVASTRGGNIGFAASTVPSVTLVLNRADAPGQFTVSTPIALVDDSQQTFLALALTSPDPLNVGGPGVVSGRNGTPEGVGIGFGGANFVMAVADFNADGSPDLVVSGSRRILTAVSVTPINFRSTIYLLGNETAGQMRVSRPQRLYLFAPTGGALGPNPLLNGGDTFVAAATGEFSRLANRVPDTVHLSLNGNIWLDSNQTSILNHAPIVTIRRQDLNARFPGSPTAAPFSPEQGGRKVVITAGMTFSVPVSAIDPDGDRLQFALVPPPSGEQPPSFVSLRDNGNNTATITINSADINRGPANAVFRIAVEARDVSATGAGGRLPLIGREFFTLIVRPNAPPTIGAVANQSVEAGRTATVNLSIADPNNNRVTTAVRCDKGSFVTAANNVLTIAPGPADVGTSTCTITATDEFGLSSSTTFAVTVTPANQPPTITAIQDQTVRAGEVRTVTVQANDPNGPAGLRLSIVSAPAFVSISDNGNGTGTLRIAPALTDSQGGRVTVQVTDAGGLSAQTSFNVQVQRAVTITAASFAKPNLFISGIGFGSSGATVSVNGTNVSSRIIGQSDTSVTLKGSKKKLGLRSGPNQITVTSGGVTSNTFVLNLLSDSED